MEGNYSCHDGECVQPYYLIRFHVVQGPLRDDECYPVERPPLLIWWRATTAVGHQKGSYPENETKQKDFCGSQLGYFMSTILIIFVWDIHMIVVCKGHDNSRSNTQRLPKHGITFLLLSVSWPFFHRHACFNTRRFFFSFIYIKTPDSPFFFSTSTTLQCIVPQLSLHSLFSWSTQSLSTFLVLLSQLTGPNLWRYPLVLSFTFYLIF